MKFLAEQEKINVKEFAKIASIPLYMASKTLVRLVVANVLQLHPQEGADFFTIRE